MRLLWNGREWDLGTRTTIGRHPSNTVCVLDSQVSKEHCEIVTRRMPHGDRDYEVHDLGSLNGTFLNGRRISGYVPLQHGDTIGLGREQQTLLVLSHEPTREDAARWTMHHVAPWCLDLPAQATDDYLQPPLGFFAWLRSLWPWKGAR